MQLFAILPLLACFVLADEQVPLKEKATGWFEKAKSYIPANPPPPVEAGAAKIASKLVEKVTFNNWKRKLSPSQSGPEEWMILITGGNHSCHGACGQVDLAWNEAVPLLSAVPSSPRLGFVDCDADSLLCHTWSTSVPSVWHYQIPAAVPGTTAGPSKLHIVLLNTTTTTAQDILKIHTEKLYEKWGEYNGFYHPIDGLVRKTGLIDPLGYILWAFGTIPSWVFMIGVSFISRQMMNRRITNSQGWKAPPTAPPAGAGAAKAK